jgi:adenosylcobinamide-GDP ribazoletransferase
MARKLLHQRLMSFPADLRSCVMFWSRLPVRSASAPPDFRFAIRALPAAALIIAAPAALALAAGRGFGCSPVLAVLLALAALAATTGALHEDGLSDCADALGAYTPERRLEIMKDSRVGAFGVLALILSVGMRVTALAVLAEASTLLACMGLLAAAAVSRVACLSPLAMLPPARATGAGKSAGTPEPRAYTLAIVGALVCAGLPLLTGASEGRAILAVAAGFGAALATVPLARKMLGGQTGDVAGAAQQLAEIAYLAVLSTSVAT